MDVKIADFSTARKLIEKDTDNEIIYDCVGTPGIRPPEM